MRHLAEQAGSSPELIAAAFLHDVGHLAHDLGEDCAERGVDDAHEHRATRILGDLFNADVIQPIALHVTAKCRLCAIDDGYHATPIARLGTLDGAPGPRIFTRRS